MAKGYTCMHVYCHVHIPSDLFMFKYYYIQRFWNPGFSWNFYWWDKNCDVIYPNIKYWPRDIDNLSKENQYSCAIKMKYLL